MYSGSIYEKDVPVNFVSEGAANAMASMAADRFDKAKYGYTRSDQLDACIESGISMLDCHGSPDQIRSNKKNVNTNKKPKKPTKPSWMY